MKQLVVLFCLFSLSIKGYSKPVDVPTAQSLAFNFYQSKYPIQDINELNLVYTSQSVIAGETTNIFYIFNTTSHPGFIIISADDRIIPVLAYSTESYYTTNRKNPAFNYWLNNYNRQITYVIENNLIADQSVSDKWNTLNINSNNERVTATSVGPLLITLWDQEDPTSSVLTYNADCPDDHSSTAADSGMTITGCVATAMSQVMKYWNWPDTGVGSVTYTQSPNPDGIPAQTANFAIAYHFDSMETPSMTSVSPYIPRLMYNAGVSVYMDYGTVNEDGSGAFVTKGSSPYADQCAEYALNNYWKYSLAKGYQRAHYTQTEWIDSMLNEMNAHRPVIYAGQDVSGQGGHCWVMDGYDRDTFFHFNWGWSGASDCYATVNALVPPGSGYKFNDQQQAIIKILPDSLLATLSTTNQIVPSHEIQIFPNPAKEFISISLNGLKAKEIMICDMNGRVMLKGNDLSFYVGNLSNGLYLIKIITENDIVTDKFIIMK